MCQSGADASDWNVGRAEDQGDGGQLEAVGGAEGTYDSGDVLVLGIDGVVEAAHVDGGEFAGEIGEGGAELRELLEGGLADDGDSVVGREIVAVILECEETEGIDKAVRGVAGDD